MTEKVRKSRQDGKHGKAGTAIKNSSDRTKHIFVQKKYRDALFRKIFHQESGRL